MDVRRVLGLSFVLWLAALPFLTAQRVTVFRSGLTLWTDARDRNPDMPRARINIADAMWKAGIEEDAITDLRTALVLLPSAPLAPVRKQSYTFLVNVELGSIAMQQGRVDEGQTYYFVAAMTDPRLVKFLQKRHE